MSVEFKVIGEDEAGIEATVEKLAEQFGVLAGAVTFERTGQDTIIGTAIGRRALPLLGDVQGGVEG